LALIILEGLDRTGKSTVAEYYQSKGYELIHQRAPAKGLSEDLYLEEMMQLVSSAAAKDIVLDRSYYGELVWPLVYGRVGLLEQEGLEALRENETSVGTTRILMHDPNVNAHWRRCVDNKEPLTHAQFLRARKLFDSIATNYGFERKTLQDFAVLSQSVSTSQAVTRAQPSSNTRDTQVPRPLSKEQMKLETANAINDVLSKRILKSKGVIYDQLESNIRTYLNTELAKIFGAAASTSPSSFSEEEVELLKFFCGKLKENKR
jgi:hypothetical protein